VGNQSDRERPRKFYSRMIYTATKRRIASFG